MKTVIRLIAGSDEHPATPKDMQDMVEAWLRGTPMHTEIIRVAPDTCLVCSDPGLTVRELRESSESLYLSTEADPLGTVFCTRHTTTIARLQARR